MKVDMSSDEEFKKCGPTGDEMFCACGCGGDDSRCLRWEFFYQQTGVQVPVDHVCCQIEGRGPRIGELPSGSSSDMMEVQTKGALGK